MTLIGLQLHDLMKKKPHLFLIKLQNFPSLEFYFYFPHSSHDFYIYNAHYFNIHQNESNCGKLITQ